MGDHTKEYRDIQNEYLDHMIRLAFDLDDLDKTRQILKETGYDFSEPDEETLQRIWQSAQEKMDRYEAAKNRRERRKAFRRGISQAMRIAACLLLALSLSVPVVLAVSPDFRSRVIKLLASFDRENEVVHFEFSEKPEESFAVPGDWTGEYFISGIPEGMTMVRCDPRVPSVEYRDNGDSGRSFVFSELAEGGISETALSGTDVRHTEINGFPAVITEGTADSEDSGTVTVTWSNGEKMFSLACRGIPAEETLKIAGSVLKIIRQ